MRRFWRFYFVRIIIGIVVIELLYFAWLQNRNHRPIAVNDATSVVQRHSVEVNLISNDTDEDNADTLKIASVDSSLHGKVTVIDEASISYMPNPGFTGVDSFQYVISDGKDESKKSWIHIQVNRNFEPTATRDVAEVYFGDNTIINVLGNDNDREADSIFVKGYTQPLYGKVNKVENKLIYSSKANKACIDSFRYVINDGMNNSDSGTVVIHIQNKNTPCYPWLSCDMGDAALPGSFSCINKTFVIKASGTDIWNSSDGFRYAYQFVSGDCELYTKVENLEGTNDWAKAGLMIRESLIGGSKCAFVCISGKNGATYHQRLSTNNRMDGGDKKSGIKAPYWVKLIRKGNSFNYYISTNGNNWEAVGNADVPMDKNVYIGFAVTSHNNSEIAKAIFSNYRLIGTIVKVQSL